MPDVEPLVAFLRRVPAIQTSIGSGTFFMPVSPPPYMNGGPDEFLSWVIEAKDTEFTPADCAEWLEGRMPRPVDDLAEWNDDDDDE